MTVAIVAFQSFRRTFQYPFRLPHKIYEAPAVMQGFKFQILVAKVSADFRQFLTQHPGLVVSTIPGRIYEQSPGRLKQLWSGIYLLGERFSLLQRRFGLAGLRTLVENKRGTKP